MTLTATARILAVDDEPDVERLILQSFRRTIREGRRSFVFARDGQQALDMVEADPGIDMVLTDINMPRMDGLTLLGHLIERRPDLRTVVVSAYGDMSNIRTAMNRGAFDFIIKPIDFADLDLTIERTLTFTAWMREQSARRAGAERARQNLARYFPPSMVDLLAGSDEPLATARSQNAAILFADIVGFTLLCANQPPDAVFTLLRDYFLRISAAVFAAGGTLDKYIGDGLMACFSTPLPTERDATNALSCALAMQAAVADWNRERREAGSDPIAAAVGLHYGPVLLGTIGDERRLELATIGDTVNIASRLEALARPLEASIVISDAMVRRVREERSGGEALLRGFCRHDGQRLRGLDDAVTVWALHRAAFE